MWLAEPVFRGDEENENEKESEREKGKWQMEMLSVTFGTRYYSTTQGAPRLFSPSLSPTHIQLSEIESPPGRKKLNLLTADIQRLTAPSLRHDNLLDVLAVKLSLPHHASFPPSSSTPSRLPRGPARHVHSLTTFREQGRATPTNAHQVGSDHSHPARPACAQPKLDLFKSFRLSRSSSLLFLPLRGDTLNVVDNNDDNDAFRLRPHHLCAQDDR